MRSDPCVSACAPGPAVRCRLGCRRTGLRPPPVPGSPGSPPILGNAGLWSCHLSPSPPGGGSAGPGVALRRAREDGDSSPVRGARSVRSSWRRRAVSSPRPRIYSARLAARVHPLWGWLQTCMTHAQRMPRKAPGAFWKRGRGCVQRPAGGTGGRIRTANGLSVGAEAGEGGFGSAGSAQGSPGLRAGDCAPGGSTESNLTVHSPAALMNVHLSH